MLSFGSLNAGDDRVVKVVYTGTPTLPKANFSASPNPVGVNSSTTFSDTSTGTPTKWWWDFGDGSTSTAQNPSHTYTAGGSYVVSLTASNATGQDSKVVNNFITVNGAPQAAFAADYTYGVVSTSDAPSNGGPQGTLFRDKSTGNPTSWSWNFGDGQASTLQNPTHVYTYTGAPGTWNVTLTATNAYGSTQVTKNALVYVKPVGAKFTMSPATGPAPLTVTFSDCSAGSPTSWSWTFGDGGSSTAQNPTHVYASYGRFTVSLTVYSSLGNDSASQQVTVTPCVLIYPHSWSTSQGPPNGNEAQVSGDMTSLQNEDSDYFVVNSSTIQNASCDPSRGNDPYDAFFAGNISDSGYSAAQIVGMKAEFEGHATGTTLGGSMFLIDAGQTWDPSGAGFSLGTTDSWTTILRNSGAGGLIQGDGTVSFVICAGGSNTASTVYSNVARWWLYLDPSVGAQKPIADFTASTTFGPYPLNVTFTDQSVNLATSWSWTFGDGGTSTAQNPSYTYNSAGVFTVALTATNALGSSTRTKTNDITVVSPNPVASFSASPVTGGAPLAVSFTDTSFNPTSWSWTFGDGGTSPAQNPSHTYTTQGCYTVALTITNPYGNNTCTQNGLIAVGPTTAVIVYPNAWAPVWSRNPYLVSGGLSNLQAQDQSYMDLHSDATNNSYSVQYTAPSGLAPSQVSKLTINYVAHYTGAEPDNTGGGAMYALQSNDTWSETGGYYLGTSDTTYTWSTTNVSNFIDSSGTVGFLTCWGCGVSAGYDILSDLMQFRLDLTNARRAGGQLLGQRYLRRRAVGGHLHRHLHQHPDLVVLELRRLQQFHGAESQPHVQRCGTYTVALTATNASGNNTCTKTGYITATQAAPVANFSGTPTSGNAPLSVTFTDSSTGAPTSWSWDFGDGNTSTAQQPEPQLCQCRRLHGPADGDQQLRQ